MEFKYKEVVEESIIYFYDHVLSCNEYTEDVFEELDHVYAQADEYEAKNKELLEELQYLRKVNDDLVWQRDTDEEHEAKAKAWDKLREVVDARVVDWGNDHMADPSNDFIYGYLRACERIDYDMQEIYG